MGGIMEAPKYTLPQIEVMVAEILKRMEDISKRLAAMEKKINKL
jgi:Fe2+ transport system protein B